MEVADIPRRDGQLEPLYRTRVWSERQESQEAARSYPEPAGVHSEARS
jgi:hypothetical protein